MKYNEQNPLRVFEAFAGYGSQSLALKRLKHNNPIFDYTIIGYSEIDPNAITAYQALHGDVKCYGDISLIDWSKVPDFDLFTCSSPCQDFSNAGLQKGGDEGSGTRSSLLWECSRAIEIKRPKYIFFENVKGLVQQKFINGFNAWQRRLETFGYVNFAKVMNATSYGIPQNRERIYMISILCDDEDINPRFFFPKEIPLELCLADMLEKDVDEKYFLSDEMLARFCEKSIEEESGCEDGAFDGEDFEDEDDFENFFVAQ